LRTRLAKSSSCPTLKKDGATLVVIAALLSVGYTLDEIINDITKKTPACFEPSIDYVVTKIPRFAFEKFKGTSNTLSTAMKSVGESMAIGRSFEESFQKALRSLEVGIYGWECDSLDETKNENDLLNSLRNPTSERILIVKKAMQLGKDNYFIQEVTNIDLWFIEKLRNIFNFESDFLKEKKLHDLDRDLMLHAKQLGFSDQQIAKLTNSDFFEVRRYRKKLNIIPIYKTVDTCSAEFSSSTPYHYSTYEESFINLNSQIFDSELSKNSKSKKIMILGGGPNRIGQGIEFDYCCCQASFSLKEAGYETIMINCNPETVSTDYDTSDRLYFEPLVEEYVQNIILKEKSKGSLLGVIAQFGGQTPIKLAKFLHDNKLPILGTQYSSIDLAEDRDRFRDLLIKLKLKQAESGIAYNFNQAIKLSEKVGLPVVVRPSYVLGGRAMEIVHDKSQLTKFINEAFKASEQNPILIDKFIDNAMEVDVDAISDGKDVYVAGIMQHIEEAGVHSGDSACCLPPVSIKENILKEIKIQTRKLALALKVKGLLNIQFAIKNDEIFVIEVNPRASRTVPFVSKANGIPLAKIASRVMAGEKLSRYKLKYKTNKRFAVKEAVFPFNKFPDSDLLLGPEMKSTGEVMGFDDDFGIAIAKSQIAASNSLPIKGLAFLSVKDSHKQEVVGLAQRLTKLGFTLSATKGTAKVLEQNGMRCKKINKVSSGKPHIVDILNSNKISLVINTGGGNSEHRISDARALRRGTLANKIPYCTNMSTAYAFIEAIRSLKTKKLTVKSLQDAKK